MREKTYWRLASLSPLMIPLVLFFGPGFRNRLADFPNTPASVGQIFSLGTLFIAGIPYILFLVIMQSFIWSKPKTWDRISSLLSPPVFLLVFLTGFQIYWSVTARGSWLDSPRALVAYSILVLVVGYLYVGSAWLIMLILRGIGIFNKSEFNHNEE